jgi:hypothetical protein
MKSPAPLAGGDGARPGSFGGVPERADDRTGRSSPQSFLAFEIADLLLEGQVGFALAAELRRRFSQAKREDFFLAISLAWTAREADLVVAEIELGMLRAQCDHGRRR